jgi:hypothetical protein
MSPELKGFSDFVWRLLCLRSKMAGGEELKVMVVIGVRFVGERDGRERDCVRN